MVQLDKFLGFCFSFFFFKPQGCLEIINRREESVLIRNLLIPAKLPLAPSSKTCNIPTKIECLLKSCYLAEC